MSKYSWRVNGGEVIEGNTVEEKRAMQEAGSLRGIYLSTFGC
jgi:hypothetical protein